MLFKRMPDVAYNYSNSITDPQFFIVKNLWRRNEVLDKYLTSLTLFDTYVIQDGETPESLARRFFNDSFLDWVILLINNIIDPFEDWPRSRVSPP